VLRLLAGLARVTPPIILCLVRDTTGEAEPKESNGAGLAASALFNGLAATTMASAAAGLGAGAGATLANLPAKNEKFTGTTCSWR